MSRMSEKRVVDRILDAYLGWREACLQVSDTYASWARARGSAARVAFGSYMAALDREQSAAEAYAGLMHRAGAASRQLSVAQR